MNDRLSAIAASVPKPDINRDAAPRFTMCYCSQCGCEIGPGNSGVSDCGKHQPALTAGDGDSTSLQAFGDGSALVRFDFEMARGYVTQLAIYGAVIGGVDADVDEFSESRIAMWRRAITRELEADARADREAA